MEFGTRIVWTHLSSSLILHWIVPTLLLFAVPMTPLTPLLVGLGASMKSSIYDDMHLEAPLSTLSFLESVSKWTSRGQ